MVTRETWIRVIRDFQEFELPKLVERDGFNLIVIGAKRKSALRRFILGSVTSKATQMASCPIFIVR